MTADHSTVPRWSDTPPDVDATGRRFGLVGIGPVGRSVVTGWFHQLAVAGAPTWQVADDDEQRVTSLLAERLAAETVGLRVMAAGPEHAVLAIATTLHAHGLLDAEVRLHATAVTDRRFYCVHCRAATTAPVDVGGEVGCTSCGRPLTVGAHLSRRTGSYLAYRVDAEELDTGPGPGSGSSGPP